MTRKQVDSFFDVAELWQRMVEKGGGRYRVRSYAQAVTLRSRCYRWRKRQLELEAQRLGEVPGIPPSTPYDAYKISLRDSKDEPVVARKPEPGSHFDLVFYVEDLIGEFIE